MLKVSVVYIHYKLINYNLDLLIVIDFIDLLLVIFIN